MVRLFTRQNSSLAAATAGGFVLCSLPAQMASALLIPCSSSSWQVSLSSAKGCHDVGSRINFKPGSVVPSTLFPSSLRIFSYTNKYPEFSTKTFHSNSDSHISSVHDCDEDVHQEKKKSQQKSSHGAVQNKKTKALFRADKVLSHRASMTRSQAFDALKRRRIGWRSDSKSEMLPIKGPKEKIAMDALIYMDGKEIPQLPPILIVYNKPKFVLSAMDEKHSDKKHLGMILPDYYKRLKMHPVGRLDYDTSGLLLFSMEGDLTQRLLHPKYKVEKEYVATVLGGRVDAELLKRRLEIDGVVTSEGHHFAKLLQVQELDVKKSRAILEDYMKYSESMDAEEREKSHGIDVEQPLTNIRLVVQEGKYRMVRRMLANCNHPVVELKRERYGHVFLKDLPVGEFRECSEDEIKWAESLLN